jgi:hypothetical protein
MSNDQAYRPPKTPDELREAFESWIVSFPYEMSIDRFPNNPERYAWPGNYVRIDVQLAWAAWQAASEVSE